VDDEVLVDTGRKDAVEEDGILEDTELLDDGKLDVLVDGDVEMPPVDTKLRLERGTGVGTAVESEDGVSDVSELAVLPRLLLATTLDVADSGDGELAGLDWVGFGVEGLEVEVPENVEVPGLVEDPWPEAVTRILDFSDIGVEVMKTTVSRLVDCGEFSDS
jgi:hypothetical protein